MRSVGLLLAAHGERRKDGENAGVVRLAAALSARNIFSEVGFGFIKGVPTIGAALRKLTAEETLVYPLFMANGYFARVRLPQLLSEATGKGWNRAVHVLPPLGLDAALGDLAIEKAAAAAVRYNLKPSCCTLILLAHGSSVDSASCAATMHLAEIARARGAFSAVHCAFLDQSPLLREVISADSPQIVVGLFVGEGLHGDEDAVRQLAQVNSAHVVFAGNVTSSERTEDIILAAAERFLSHRSGCQQGAPNAGRCR